MSKVDDLYQEHYDMVREPYKAYIEMRDLAKELENEGVVQVYAARKLAMVYVESNEAYEKQIQELKDLVRIFWKDNNWDSLKMKVRVDKALTS